MIDPETRDRWTREMIDGKDRLLRRPFASSGIAGMATAPNIATSALHAHAKIEEVPMAMAKPLHVRVAEALGWRDCVPTLLRLDGQAADDGLWIGLPPDGRHVLTKIDHDSREVVFSKGPGTVDRYDTSWSATGLLIERYGITVGINACNGKWHATVDHLFESESCLGGESADYHETPLIAVCNLILALAEAGKLKPAGE